MIDSGDEILSNHEREAPAGWIHRYVFDELTELERDRFEEHLFDCPQCSHKVRTAYLLVRGAEAAFRRDLLGPGEERQNAGLRQELLKLKAAQTQTRVWRKPAMVAAAFTLAVTAGYQNLLQIPALHRQVDLASAIQSAPILLLSETRSGDRPVAPAGAGFVALILPNSPGSRPAFHDCQLRDVTGQVVRRFRVKGVPDVDEWELRLPTHGLRPTLYTLEIRSVSDANGVADNSIARYQFRLESQKGERE